MPVLLRQGPVIVVVALGGAVGASARYGLALRWPTAPEAFPWTALWINVIGSALIGVFMVIISDVWAGHRLLRPFVGTGVLGGFTTFSAYAIDTQTLVQAGHPRAGLAYLVTTLLLALMAVWTAAATTRRLIRWRQR